MKKTYGYARVSTREQHLDRQLKALMDAGVEERDIITDKVSGKDLEREGYQSLKNRNRSIIPRTGKEKSLENGARKV